MKKIIFSDFDGTLTYENREMPVVFFEILNHLKKNQQELVIVSGRSLSWGHFFMTHFPMVEAVIMEGGGVILSRNQRGDIIEEILVTEHEVRRLESTAEDLKNIFPHCPLSVDSFGRKTDRAIEFEEMQDEQISQVLDFFKTKKINYSKSNVHINFWCGEISKFKGVKKYLESYRTKISMEDCLFFGDAPNDESMFQFFPHSVGVSNIDKYLSRITHKPKVILEGKDKEGPHGVLWYLKNL
jgi:HAD superfamily hydrolase (TIGR01484 family)